MLSILGAVFIFNLYAEEDKAPKYKELEWVALIPKDDLQALLNPPEQLASIQDGSEQDSIAAFENKKFEDKQTKRFQQALTSKRVVEAYAQQAIRIPGFIVPLESDEQQKVIEFFIVPYFGACLHMPPPPPNQIIYAKFKQGIELDNLYEPYWFEGTLLIQTEENELGTSAYEIKLDNIALYEL